MWVQARVPLFLLLGSLSIVGSFGFALLHPTAQHPTRFFATSATEQDIPKSLDGEQVRIHFHRYIGFVLLSQLWFWIVASIHTGILEQT